MTTGPKRRDPEERFWEKVDKSGDCWVWTAGKTVKGYGTFRTWPRRLVLAHRFAYESVHGEIPDGLELDHRVTCSKSCVRPDHLRPVTHRQNQQNRSLVGQSNNKSSGVRGVTWDKQVGRWKAQVHHMGRNHNLGFYETVEAAAAAASTKRLELFTHSDADIA